MSGNGALRIPSTTEIPAEGHNHAKGTPLFLLMQKRPDRTEAYPAWREKKTDSLPPVPYKAGDYLWKKNFMHQQNTGTSRMTTYKRVI